MAFKLTIFIMLLLSISSQSLSTSQSLLSHYGLPPGLFPDSILSYSISSDNTFTVNLNSTCYRHFEYLVFYDKTISGKLSYGSIVELKGIQVKKMFLWVDVDEIRVHLHPSDSIYFRVGFVEKKLDVAQFDKARSCRVGLWNRFLQLPTAVEDVEMLITE